MITKNMRYDSYGKLIDKTKALRNEKHEPDLAKDDLVFPEQNILGDDLPGGYPFSMKMYEQFLSHSSREDVYDLFDEDFFYEEESPHSEMRNELCECPDIDMDELVLTEEDNIFRVANDKKERILEVYYNKYDEQYSSFNLIVNIGGKKRRIDSRNYLQNNLHDDVFDPFLQTITEKHDFKNKDPLCFDKNKILDIFFPSGLIKDETFWDAYQIIKKRFGRSHFKDGFIYFDDTRLFMYKGKILYKGYVLNDINTFITDYSNKRFDRINPKYASDPEFVTFLTSI